MTFSILAVLVSTACGIVALIVTGQLGSKRLRVFASTSAAAIGFGVASSLFDEFPDRHIVLSGLFASIVLCAVLAVGPWKPSYEPVGRKANFSDAIRMSLIGSVFAMLTFYVVASHYGAAWIAFVSVVVGVFALISLVLGYKGDQSGQA